MLYSEQPTVLLARRLLNTMILINFENLNFIANIFRETHDFLVLTDPVVICTYLKTTDRHFRDWGNVRHPTLMLLKCDLVKTSNTFLNPSFRIFAAGKVALFYFIPIYFTQFLLKSFYWINLVISFVCKFFFGLGTINNKFKYEEYEKVRVCDDMINCTSSLPSLQMFVAMYKKGYSKQRVLYEKVLHKKVNFCIFK